MQIVKRFSTLTLAALAVAASTVPASAQAHSASCVFEGGGGTLAPGIMLVGGSGDYSYWTDVAACELDGSGVQTSTIQTSGQFANTLCGTGTWWSGFNNPSNSPPDFTTIDVGVLTPPEITSAEYTIDFRASQGTLKVTRVNGATELGGDDVDGSVTFGPTWGDCRTGVSRFQLHGAFHLEW